MEDEAPPSWEGLTWKCSVCSVSNVGSNEVCGTCMMGDRPALAARDDPLAPLLLDETARHVKEATRSVANAKTLLGARSGAGTAAFESQHPVPIDQAVVHITVEGSSSLYVEFDVTCESPGGSRATRVEFFADKELTCLVAVRAGPKAEFCKPFLAPCSELFARTVHPEGEGDEPWHGWSCTARGLNGVRWSGERQVSMMPSIEWGTWLVEQLSSKALTPAMLRSGALHTERVLAPLCQYAGAAQVPFAADARRCLMRLVSCPQYFSSDSPPDLAPILRLRDAVQDDLLKRDADSPLFLAPGVQEMCELVSAADMAQQYVTGDKNQICVLDLAARAKDAPLADQGAEWDPTKPGLGASPPLNPQFGVPSDFSLITPLQAMSLLREALKGVAAGADAEQQGLRAARIPDPWVVAASLLARNAGEFHELSMRELVQAHMVLSDWPLDKDKVLVDLLHEKAKKAKKDPLDPAFKVHELSVAA